MDRKTLLLPLFLCVGCGLLPPLYAQNRTPDWYIDKELRYPASRYIAAVGEGKSRADAESAAIAGVSLFFNTKTEVRNQAIREFNEAVTNNTTDFSKKTYISESAVISSDQEFLGVHLADSFLIQQRQTWAALAYIDRGEAARIYESKISATMAAIDALTEDANRETEALYTCGLLFRALKLADLTEEYIKTAAVVDPQSAQKYAPAITRIQTLRSAYRATRDGLTFAVRANAEDETGRIERKLQELLEDNGYIVTTRNPQYSVSLRLTMSEEDTASGLFIRSGIAVRLERNGKALLSYSKNYPRHGHKNRDGAYNRAYMAIEQDLEENFMAKLAGMIGN